MAAKVPDALAFIPIQEKMREAAELLTVALTHTTVTSIHELCGKELVEIVEPAIVKREPSLQRLVDNEFVAIATQLNGLKKRKSNVPYSVTSLAKKINAFAPPKP
ncbi:MAG: hypothetical protein WDO70_10160 [Alphaproteobacteria bacterium]